MEFAFDDDDDDESNNNSSTSRDSQTTRVGDDRERDDGNGDGGEGSELPYPVEGDDVGPHPAFRDEHEIDQVWFHKARDMENEDSDTKHEYHHSEPTHKIQSTTNDSAVIYSDWVVNLKRSR